MPKFEIVTADIVEWSAAYDGPKFHALLSDPPYGLEFMGKEWDSPQKFWEQGAGFASPGIGERNTPWPSSYSASAPNLTCAACGGRLRGKNKCKCEEPQWKPMTTRRGKTVSPWPPAGNLGGFADGNKPSFARQGDIGGKYQEWCERWAAEMVPVLHPGALALYFGGTRTWHRLACGIEDSGMAMWDTLMWLHGQGFPKAQDISKLIDKKNGDKREVVGEVKRWGNGAGDGRAGQYSNEYEPPALGAVRMDPVTKAASDESNPWSGHKTCALKPAWEPVLCFKAPMGNKNYAQLAAEHGSGALNIDGARIPTDETLQTGSGGLWSHIRDDKPYPYPGKGSTNGLCGMDNAPSNGREGEASAERRYTEEGSTNFAASPGPRGGDAKGRYPANLSLECTCEEIRLVDAPVCGDIPDGRVADSKGIFGDYAKSSPFQAYRGKAMVHTDPDCPAAILDGQAGERKTTWVSPNHQNNRSGEFLGELGHPGWEGFNDSGGPSRFFYCAKSPRKERETGLFGLAPCVKCGLKDSQTHVNPKTGKTENCIRNSHPTVKPLGIAKYLATLLLPPSSVPVRRILVPFSGSGSEMVACLLAGWDEVVGVEQDPIHAEVARLRCEAALRGEYGPLPGRE